MAGTTSSLILFFILAATTTALSIGNPIPHSNKRVSLISTTKYKFGNRYRPRPQSNSVKGPTSERLLDFFNGTDLQWFGNISVGTPPQTFTVRTACGAACINQRQFNASASSTFADQNKSTTFTFGTAFGVTPPPVNGTFNLTVNLITETVSVVGLTAHKHEMFLITDSKPIPLDVPFDGIMGMSPGSPFFQAAKAPRSLFGMLFTPHDKGGEGELTMGGVDRTKFKSPLVFSPVVKGDEWVLQSLGVAVNGKTSSVLNTSFPVIFDTGTSNMLFAKDIALEIYGMISPDIVPNEDVPGTFGIACDRIPSLPAEIDITFPGTSVSGREPFNLTLPSSELSVGPFADKPDICQTLINVADQPNLNLVGLSVFKHYYTAWDMDALQIGFSPNGF
ncbi:acid protease [Favolaschia claudopus]|uniref:Acid protease n=1 Tax=Favolaschia claudopus TaxID=2862362 RepID=A0AAV9ZZZ9_9AGAR